MVPTNTSSGLCGLLCHQTKQLYMKTTIKMLAYIATWFFFWLFIALIPYMASDMPYKECLSHPGVQCIALFLGWIPALIVVLDMDN